MTELQTQRDGIKQNVTELQSVRKLQTQRDGITEHVTELQIQTQSDGIT